MIARRTVLALALSLTAVAGLGLPAFAQETRLNPNTATAEELAGVTGVSPELAAAIEAQRPFPTMIEFNALVTQFVPAAETQALYEQLFVPINLNSARPEEIALIPGMSQRMVREFLEYRPYADISVFDREIGKYVNDAEVARLRSYVTL